MTTTTISRPASNPIAWPSLLWIGAIHVGALFAFVPSNFTWPALAVCVFLHWLTGGHRDLHDVPPIVDAPQLRHSSEVARIRPDGLRLRRLRRGGRSAGSPTTASITPIPTNEEDVHSPNRGFGWAHMLWWMTPDVTSIHTPEYYDKWAPDLLRDPVHRWSWTSIHFVFPIAVRRLALYAIGGMPWLVWGFFVRTVLVLHATWLVNSATHVWGYRSHQTRDDSTNLWWVAHPHLRRRVAQQPPRLPDFRRGTVSAGGRST